MSSYLYLRRETNINDKITIMERNEIYVKCVSIAEHTVKNAPIISRRFLSQKMYSFTFGLFSAHQKELEYLNSFGIDMGNLYRILGELVFNSKSTYTLIPLREMAYALKLSKDNIYTAIQFLHNVGLVTIKKEKYGYTLYKLNSGDMLAKDEYFAKIYAANETNYRITQLKLSAKRFSNNQSPYKLPTDKKRMYAEIRTDMIGLIIAYNEVYQANSKFYCELDGVEKRKDIDYYEIPMELLCSYFGWREHKIMAFIKKHITKSTKYMKLHNLCYVDKKQVDDVAEDIMAEENKYNTQHYMNPTYKEFPLEDYVTGQLEVGHPVVTEYSAIGFRPQTQDARIWKKIDKKSNKYKAIVGLFQYIQNTENTDEYSDGEDFLGLNKKDQDNEDDEDNNLANPDRIYTNYTTDMEARLDKCDVCGETASLFPTRENGYKVNERRFYIKIEEIKLPEKEGYIKNKQDISKAVYIAKKAVAGMLEASDDAKGMSNTGLRNAIKAYNKVAEFLAYHYRELKRNYSNPDVLMIDILKKHGGSSILDIMDKIIEYA